MNLCRLVRHAAAWGAILLSAIGLAPAAASASDMPADEELVQMVLGLLEEDDKDLRALGLEQVRTAAPGEAATRRFADHVAKLSAPLQAGLILALADRGDTAALHIVYQGLAPDRPEPVRLAAIAALGRLGSADDIQQLLNLTNSTNRAQSAAALSSLVQLRGDTVPQALAAELTKGPTELRLAVLRALVERKAHGVADKILPLAVEQQPALRRAAMQALGELARGEQLAGMFAGVLHAPAGEEREAAEKAVMFASQRIENDGQRSQLLLAAYRSLPERDRPSLLPTLGRVGGEPVLRVIDAALASAAQREAGLRALCNWPDASVAPRLLTLYRQEKDAKRQTMILQALVRVAPLPDGRADGERLELLQTVFGLCQRPDDKTLVVKRARAVRSVETLRFILPLVDQPALAETACETVVELAHHRNLREPHKAEFDAALDKVLAVSRDATSRDRAERYKKGQTWVRPK